MTQEQKVIRAKVGVLELAEQLGNVSQACKMMGYSRDSIYRFKELYRWRAGTAGDQPQEANPQESGRARGRGCREQPTWGPGAGCQRTEETGLVDLAVRGADRLVAFGEHQEAPQGARSQDGFVLTEAQVAALEKAKTEKEVRASSRERMSRLLRSRTPSMSAT
jgi:hypothetical protein